MNGLTSTEAARRLAAEGANELAQDGRRRVWQIAFEVLREPMLLMLLAAGAIYISLGDLQEALLIVVLASASIVVTIVQEARRGIQPGEERDGRRLARHHPPRPDPSRSAVAGELRLPRPARRRRRTRAADRNQPGVCAGRGRLA